MERILLVNIFIKTLILIVTSWIIVCFQSLIMIHFRSFEENLCLDRNILRKLLKCSIHFKPLLMPVALIHIWEILSCFLLPCAKSVQEVCMTTGTVRNKNVQLS